MICSPVTLDDVDMYWETFKKFLNEEKRDKRDTDDNHGASDCRQSQPKIPGKLLASNPQLRCENVNEWRDVKDSAAQQELRKQLPRLSESAGSAVTATCCCKAADNNATASYFGSSSAEEICIDKQRIELEEFDFMRTNVKIERDDMNGKLTDRRLPSSGDSSHKNSNELRHCRVEDWVAELDCNACLQMNNTCALELSAAPKKLSEPSINQPFALSFRSMVEDGDPFSASIERSRAKANFSDFGDPSVPANLVGGSLKKGCDISGNQVVDTYPDDVIQENFDQAENDLWNMFQSEVRDLLRKELLAGEVSDDEEMEYYETYPTTARSHQRTHCANASGAMTMASARDSFTDSAYSSRELFDCSLAPSAKTQLTLEPSAAVSRKEYYDDGEDDDEIAYIPISYVPSAARQGKKKRRWTTFTASDPDLLRDISKYQGHGKKDQLGSMVRNKVSTVSRTFSVRRKKDKFVFNSQEERRRSYSTTEQGASELQPQQRTDGGSVRSVASRPPTSGEDADSKRMKQRMRGAVTRVFQKLRGGGSRSKSQDSQQGLIRRRSLSMPAGLDSDSDSDADVMESEVVIW